MNESKGARPRWDRRTIGAIGGLLLVVILGSLLAAHFASPERDFLTIRHLTNTLFDPPPPEPSVGRLVSTVWSDFLGPGGERFRREMLPTQSGVLWISLIVALMVAFDYSRPGSARNFALLALVGLGFLLFNIMRFFALLNDPIYFWVMDWVYRVIMVVVLFLVGLAVWKVRHPETVAWRPNLPTRALVTLTAVLLGIDVLIGMVSPPDDAGFYTNLGAQHLRETGRFPYGDPLLSGSAGAGYGPMLYLGHLPFQFLLDPKPLNRRKPTRAELAAGAEYRLPPLLASQLTNISFHLLGVTALVLAVWRLAGARAAWGIAAVYCGSAAVLGVGGPPDMIGGITFISHIAPASMSLLAFAALSSPMAAGVLLVASAATVFYPVLFFPAWLGYYWDRRPSVWRFLAGVAIGGAVIGGPVLALSQATEGHSLLATVVRETVGHHQGTDTYGLSTYGFWGQRSGIRAVLREPFVEGEFTTSPMFLMTIGFAAAMFFLARKTTPQQLALISGALGIVAQLSKIHGTGVYLNWYTPLLLIGFLASGPRPPDGSSTEELP